MKIAIITAVYAPLSTPRALRAAELAKEFGKMGHLVTVYNCTSFEGKEPPAMRNVNYVDLGIRKISNLNANKGLRHSIFIITVYNYFKKILFYWTLGTWLIYYRGIKKRFYAEEKYDLLISIGLPFTIHWGISTKFSGHSLAKCYVADYGDPFSKGNININVAHYFRMIEKKVINKFDYISIPTERALDSYTWLKSNTYIKVIPQGFNLEEVALCEYHVNNIPTFAYAGIFYPDIRNPQKLFDFLVSLQFDYRFIIYTAISNTDSYSCILPYISKLGEKLVVKDYIPREELIKELSKVDFIVNINNITNNQIPSKLIDYALSKRPIFSCSPCSIDNNKFLRFCQGDYNGQENIDLNKHNIHNIASAFCGLAT